VESEEEGRRLSRHEQTKLELALRIAIQKGAKKGWDGSLYQDLLYEASIGLFPQKLGQVYNLLKAVVGFDPLGRDTHPEGEKQPGPTRSQDPTTNSLQDLIQRIYEKAKAEPALRFRALYVHVTKLETLREAYRLAKKNDGAPGIDGVTFEAIEEGGAERFLAEIRDELVTRRYRPLRNRKEEIPKGDGRVRVLGIPAIRDRVVQGALKLILEPIFEADFQPGSYGYRPGRTAQEAVHRVAEAIAQGKTQVIDLDLKAYFDNVQHHLLLEKVARRVEDKDVLHLLKLILKASGKKGVPQGGVISPVLSNLYLTEVDKMLEKAKEVTREGERTVVEYARYADDLVVLVRDQPRDAWLLWAIPKRLREEFGKLGVAVNEEKSRTVDLRQGDDFGFLGFEFRRVRSRKGRWRPNRAPKLKKRTELLGKLREIFRSLRSQPVEQVVARINPILRGWVNYFRVGNSSRCLCYIRQHVEKKIRRHLMRARLRSGYGWKRWSTAELTRRLGLFSDYRVRYYSDAAKALPCQAAT
jgi:RNA-directed DNA polymerase